jgi:hypothetical protein
MRIKAVGYMLYLNCFIMNVGMGGTGTVISKCGKTYYSAGTSPAPREVGGMAFI